jgi:hypothetical protein
MNNETQTSLAGNSRFLEMQADNRFTHHRNHLPDALKEEVAEEEVAEEVAAEEAVAEEAAAEEMEEEGYLHQQDQACFLRMDELLTQNS